MFSSYLTRSLVGLGAIAMMAATCAAQTTQQEQPAVRRDIRVRVERGDGAGGGFGGGTWAAPNRIYIRRTPPRMEKAAFLGVVTAPVPPALREQLKLKPGIGLVVESVQKDSPAETAGLKRYDVLQKLDDQWLVNSQQFAVLVRMHNPGEQVSLSVVRGAQPQTLTAKLTEKELPALDETNAWGIASGEVFDNPFVAPEGNVVFKGPGHDADFDALVHKLQKGQHQTMTLTMSDDQNTLTLDIRDGHQHLNATDKNGKVVFDGPIDTPEQREKLPPEIARKLEKLQTRPNMVRLHHDDEDAGATTAPDQADQP